MSDDMIFKSEDGVFSYRVAAIIIHDGAVLLHRAEGSIGYAFPGGHVSFGETSEEALKRELREEISTEIDVLGVRWVAENFFSWDQRSWHQLCLYYDVQLPKNSELQRSGSFNAIDVLEGQSIKLTFSWIPLESLSEIKIYPSNAKEMLLGQSKGIEHFIYKESVK